MDASNLVVLALVVIGLVIGPRFVLQSVGRASDGIAQLFVPPDRDLGWPHGVQEGDEPWGWHEARDGTAAFTIADTGPEHLDAGARDPMWSEIIDLPGTLADHGVAAVSATTRFRA